MKRGRQGERTDLKTDADRQRNRQHGKKGGKIAHRRGTANRLTSKTAKALNDKRWNKS